ncbi:steroid 17-alpha-hydroxylase/17,20 lyase-like [Glandiceps talaboti]
MLTEILLLAVPVFFILFAWLRNKPTLPKTYPKGPPGWPVLGNLLQLGPKPHLKLTEWSRQYGAVYSLRLCQKNVVVLNSYKALSEAMVDRQADFAGRPRDFTTWNVIGKSKNIGFQDYNELWKLLRKVTQTALRMHGTGRWSEIINEQMDDLIDNFTKKGSLAFDPHLPLTLVGFNTVSEITQSETYEESDPKFTDYIERSREIFELLSEASAVDYASYLKPLFQPRLNRAQVLISKHISLAKGKVEERGKTTNRQNPRDMVDMLLLAKEDFEKDHKPGIAKDFVFDKDVITHTMVDYLLAGSETVISSMKWLLVDLMTYPEKQKKIHQEIDAVVGRDRRPVYADHDKLHYLKAAMYESIRLHTIGPFSIFHRTICNSSIDGCEIPEDTIIIPNHWAIAHDPDSYKDPYIFRPERFLDSETGECVSAFDHFMPFGMGRRVCPGEMLAKMEYFLVASILLQHFEVAIPIGHDKPSTDGLFGLTYVPRPFKMTVKRR